MTTMHSTHATKIRQALKTELGLNSRQVSVKTGQGGTSSAVDVDIKVAGVKVADVERVAAAATAPRTPRFLTVDLADSLSGPTEDVLRCWLDRLPISGACVPIPGSDQLSARLSVSHSGAYEYTVWSESQAHSIGSGNEFGCAAIVARLFIESGREFSV